MQNLHKHADRFTNDHEALDFVSSRIANEAQLDGVPLSEVERKMLYFSETAWTLPDIWEVSDEFDRDYERVEYEKKISKLTKKAVARAHNDNPEDFAAWTSAIRRLRENDRYLLVMVRQAGLGLAFRSARPIRYRWRYWAACAVVGLAFSGFTWVLERLDPYPVYISVSGVRRSRLGDTIGFAFWAFSISLIIIYELLRLLFGAGKIDGIADHGTEWIFARGRRSK
jgi:hypothetical protein